MAANHPTVSCIIPTYNRVCKLGRAICSVRKQTVSVSELIVVDDGSTDGTYEFLRNLPSISTSARLVILRQDNRGPAAARNAGLRMATGQFVAFLDDDDIWLPRKIARQLIILAAHPNFALLGCASDTPFLPGRPRVFRIGELGLLFRNWFITSGVIARRDVLLELGGFPEDMRICEDYALWLKISTRHHCALYNEVLVEYGHGKRGFGDSGLTADLVALRVGERAAIKKWRANSAPSVVKVGLASSLAFARHLRRQLVVGLRQRTE